MNQNQIEGIRKQVTGRIKETWGQLTRDKPMIVSGKCDQLIGKLQERHSYADARDQGLTSRARVQKLDEAVTKAFDGLRKNIE